MADEAEQQQARDRHYDAMRYFQELRTDVDNVLNDTINRHYDYPPADLEAERVERDKLRSDLREIQARIDRTLSNI